MKQDTNGDEIVQIVGDDCGSEASTRACSESGSTGSSSSIGSKNSAQVSAIVSDMSLVALEKQAQKLQSTIQRRSRPGMSKEEQAIVGHYEATLQRVEEQILRVCAEL